MKNFIVRFRNGGDTTITAAKYDFGERYGIGAVCEFYDTDDATKALTFVRAEDISAIIASK